jgi:hypothetical protein
MGSNNEIDIRFLDAAVELLGRSGVGGTFQVRGESMTPTLRAGDVVAVDFSRGPLRRGDVVLFRRAGYLTVHRLLGRTRAPDGRPCLRTRGDGRNGLDPPLDRSHVHGRVVAVLGDGGWRDMRAAGARFYARALAFHDLVWAALGVVASRADRLGEGVGWRLSLRSATAAMDQRLLGLLHRLLFASLHRSIDRPEGIPDQTPEEPHCP